MSCQNYQSYGCGTYPCVTYGNCYTTCASPCLPYPTNCVQVCTSSQPCPSPCPIPVPCPVTIVEYITTAPTATTIESSPTGMALTPIPVGSTSIPSGTVTVITGYAATPVRSIGGITLNSALGQFTVPLAGSYLITGYIGFSYNAVGIREVYVYKVDGATSVITLISTDSRNTTATNPTYISYSAMDYFNAGDRIFIAAAQNSGSTITTTADNRIAITRMNRQ
ncbi:hypothetical protein [Acanthamoeba castellanii mimivirus]|nr:hypothetical protein MIMI_L688 [Acanthamoeba polyphaga mimivirus]AHA45147.1 hypothetical protein HIRU_S241 [Hirudovirus strain Sangsue]AHJ40316.2 hypothetical protein [Samba virus]AMZ03132.1 hypothetical protein [Mimivirus Bombay]EJN41097.1 hypothetical protein lvs_L594 [Acanthamoeba polyphaga lentillevirus]QTF49625.1 hypothetical protein [Mimivirus reunion]WMV62068.1 hypothetical protein qu_734 [Mimivirus sp.]BAV61818.1 hypothetical protein [Acanthamoeba castellanii mimivirus]